MYKVLCDDALMCDSRIEELALINPVVTLEENKAGSFSFTIPPEHPMYDAVTKRKSLVQVFRDDEMVFSGICTEEKKDFYKQKTVYCEGELTFFNDSVQRPAKYQGITVRGLLEAYIAAHNAQVEEAKRFTVGQVTVTDPNDYIYCFTNMESTMKALKEDLVDDLGGFFRIRHEGGIRYLDYLAESPNTNSQVIKLGKNLMDFSTNIDSSDIATAIIPLGAKLEESPVEGLEVRLTIESVNDGLDYVHSEDAVAAYGWIYKTVEWNDVTTAEALKRKGEQYLSDIQFENMVIKAKAVDLHLTDGEIEQFKISDQIRVVSAPHGLNRYFRLTKQTMNLNNPEKDTITLGKDEKLSLSAKSNQASEEIKKAIESIVPPNHILNQAVANATELITSAMGGYVVKTNDELLIMDTDSIKTATKVWRWNINGLGYSSTGYDGEYALAMTIDGAINADFIKSGTIYGRKIVGGSLEIGKADGETHAQIDSDGKLTAKGAVLHGHMYNVSWDGKREAEINDAAVIFSAYEEAEKNIVGMVVNFGNTMNILCTSSLNFGKYDEGSNNYFSYYTMNCGDDTEYRHGFAGLVGFSDLITLISGLKTYGNITMASPAGEERGETPATIGCTAANDYEAAVTANHLVVYGDANVWGSLYTSSGTIAGSDRDIKNSIEQLDKKSACEFVYALKPSRFKYNNGTSNRFHHGLIAQEVKEAMGSDDWGVYVDSQDKICGHKGIRYEELIADLIAVVQSQNERIKALEERLGITNE